MMYTLSKKEREELWKTMINALEKMVKVTDKTKTK